MHLTVIPSVENLLSWTMQIFFDKVRTYSIWFDVLCTYISGQFAQNTYNGRYLTMNKIGRLFKETNDFAMYAKQFKMNPNVRRLLSCQAHGHFFKSRGWKYVPRGLLLRRKCWIDSIEDCITSIFFMRYGSSV